MGSLFNGREMHTNNYSSEMSAKMKKKKKVDCIRCYGSTEEGQPLCLLFEKKKDVNLA